MPEHSNVYYKREKDGTYTPCKNAVGVKNEIGADLFRDKGLIYEGSTGVFVCNGSRLDELMSNMKGREDKFNANVQHFVKEYGLTPRYTQPEVKKDDLFKHDDSHVLFKTLYHKEKCWFTRFQNEHGLDLYSMDKEKSNYITLYTPCNGWMIGLGPSYGIDKIAETMKQPDFNLYEKIKTQFESELADPIKWADVGVAEFLGRVDEAKSHNQPIREMRDAENREREAQREAERREREELKANKYKNAISGAEKAILEKMPIDNKEIDGKNLILQLFRENGIELPLKTQGWVKATLAQIFCYSDGDWSYRYKLSGGPSTVMDEYLNKLVEAVENKYWRIDAEKEKPDAKAPPEGKPSILGDLEENKKIVASRQTNTTAVKKEQTEL